jgi:hypothetical protein
MSDEELLSIPSRLYHFLMCEYISSDGRFHIPDGHMAQFPALCDYIQQGRATQAETHKKFKKNVDVIRCINLYIGKLYCV